MAEEEDRDINDCLDEVMKQQDPASLISPDILKQKQKVAQSRIYALHECSEHVFHGDCLTKHFQVLIDESKFPLVCPDPKCKIEVTNTDLNILLCHSYLEKF